jgi:hypothetical protein
VGTLSYKAIVCFNSAGLSTQLSVPKELQAGDKTMYCLTASEGDESHTTHGGSLDI